MHYPNLFALLLLLTIASCGRAPKNAIANEVPWSEATFIRSDSTIITIENNTTEVLALGLDDIRGCYFAQGKMVPDSLFPTESFAITVAMHHPDQFFVSLGKVRSIRPLLPGHDRHFTQDGGQLEERGPEAELYNYFDAVLEPFNRVGRFPPEISDVADYWNANREAAQAHYDSIPRPPGLPAYLEGVVLRSLDLQAAQEALFVRDYRKFFYADTLMVPAFMVDSIQRLLQQPDYYHAINHRVVYESLVRYLAEPAYDQEQSLSTNYKGAVTNAYLKTGYPLPEKQTDAMAVFLLTVATNPKVYSGKMQYMDTLRQVLPADYREAVARVERELQARNTSREGLTDFLTTPLATLADGEVAPAVYGSKKFRLYKFYFAGCTPCLWQMPDEEELLATYDNVDLLYVVHSTPEVAWRKYVDKYQPPATHHLRTKRDQIELIKGAAGSTGAPIYVLTDTEGEVICRPCPKPSDPLLAEIIAQHL